MTWQEAWNEGETPWDAGASAPALQSLIVRDVLPNGRALVPGCGSGYDVLELASDARRAIGIDLAEGAVQRFEQIRQDSGVEPSRAEVRVGDFFEMRFREPFDVVFDYTFLCAIPYVMRRKWARRVSELLKPGGQLVTLIFPAAKLGVGPVSDAPPTSRESSPPYRLIPDAVWHLVAPTFDNIELFQVEKSHPGREGREWLGRWRRNETSL